MHEPRFVAGLKRSLIESSGFMRPVLSSAGFRSLFSRDCVFAYLLLLLAALSRVAPHPGWLNFTAVGASLLYFGAKRPLREAVVPVAV